MATSATCKTCDPHLDRIRAQLVRLAPDQPGEVDAAMTRIAPRLHAVIHQTEAHSVDTERTTTMLPKLDYIARYKSGATQLRDGRTALAWRELGIDVDTAAAWASAGWLPDEAAPLIAQGLTPELAAAGDEALVAERGVIGAAVTKLALEHPGATVLVDPDVEAP